MRCIRVECVRFTREYFPDNESESSSQVGISSTRDKRIKILFPKLCKSVTVITISFLVSYNSTLDTEGATAVLPLMSLGEAPNGSLTI